MIFLVFQRYMRVCNEHSVLSHYFWQMIDKSYNFVLQKFKIKKGSEHN